MSIALGTLPDWIAGVSTLGALIAASLAAKAAFGQIRHAGDLESARIERERRSQTSQIAVWIESNDPGQPQEVWRQLNKIRRPARELDGV